MLQRLVERSVYLIGLGILAAFCKLMTMRAGIDVWWFFDLGLILLVTAMLAFQIAIGVVRARTLLSTRFLVPALLLAALAGAVTLALGRFLGWQPWSALAAGLSAACVAWAVAG